MHSQFSGDSHTPQEDMIAAARQKNLKGICFTDHLDIDYPDEPETFLLDLPNYVSSVDAMQEKYKEVLPVRLGIELGLQPHLACLHADILSQYPFDFVIGSSHVMHGVDPYYPAYWENVNAELASKGIPQEAIDKLQPIILLSGSNDEKLETLKTVLATSE